MVPVTYIVRIDPDGTVTRCEGRDVLDVAALGLQLWPAYTGETPWGNRVENARGVDVTSTQPHRFAPLPSTDVSTVLVVHEWGWFIEPPLAINRKAWAMYGRSPLVGPAWVAIDGSAYELPDEWIDAVSAPLESWCDPRALREIDDYVQLEYRQAGRPIA